MSTTLYNNKVVYGGKVLMDLTADTVEADKLLSGLTAHDKSGAPIVGTCTFDSDTSDATVAVSEMLVGQTAYARGAKIEGTMVDNGAFDEEITTVDGDVVIPVGYHDGSGKVAISAADKEKLVPRNILSGIEILGVVGTSEPSSSVTSQAKSVTPTTEEQVVVPDAEMDYLTQVTVAAIPYTEAENAAGGTTVTIL